MSSSKACALRTQVEVLPSERNVRPRLTLDWCQVLQIWIEILLLGFTCTGQCLRKIPGGLHYLEDALFEDTQLGALGKGMGDGQLDSIITSKIVMDCDGVVLHRREDRLSR